MLLPDRYRVLVVAFADPETSLDACVLADVGIDSVLAALRASSLPRRPLTGPANSLVWINDACSLGDDGALRAIPGLDATRERRQMAGWECVWGADPTRAQPPTARILLANTYPSAPPTTVIAGRTATVLTRGTRLCAVELVQRSYTGTSGESRVEAMQVAVDLGDSPPPGASCPALAAGIAVAAAGKLPQPS